MRVQTIEMADYLLTSTVIRDSEGAFQWVVLVSERCGERRALFERRGSCGRMSWGDALDLAAQAAHSVALELASMRVLPAARSTPANQSPGRVSR
ncbi:hypothetical protein LJ656_06660 [Paraburkholderia sp. MMS20-SJTR3]|uniref:Uncharacterized protein n=1 Tax=Paraburkholderia sejongensis TaxID=2886946 RepID=A0ABS8JQU5_9BURK|nr:hypothetical protein [Paraburkholderia sp. MMS20-SJTR3]MCC8392266.1 hypothetical protein [Paraburkholderia sp. MMS20-SJTR3]